MSTKALVRNGSRLPQLFDDFFKPWNEWFDKETAFMNRMLTVPAVNITETTAGYELAFAVPGMSKEDFDVHMDGNMLTISCEKETGKEEEENAYTRKEYNYSSFRRSFSLPEEVSKDAIQANYTNGILKLHLPKKEEARKLTAKAIAVK